MSLDSENSQVKKTRKKLKDRMAEVPGALSLKTENLLAEVSRRRRSPRTQSKHNLKANPEHHHQGHTEIQSPASVFQNTKPNVISENPVTTQSHDIHTDNKFEELPTEFFSTSPETVSSIRLHLGLAPKSNNLVDLQATYRQVLDQPKSVSKVKPLLNFALPEDLLGESSDPVNSQFETDNSVVIKPYVLLRQVETQANNSVINNLNQNKQQTADLVAAKIIQSQNQLGKKNNNVQNKKSLRFDQAHYWLEALRFGVMTAALGALMIVFTTWQNLVSQAADITRETSQAITRTTEQFSGLILKSDEKKKTDSNGELITLPVNENLSADWKRIGDTLQTLTTKNPFLTNLPGISETLATAKNTTQALSEVLAALSLADNETEKIRLSAKGKDPVIIAIKNSASEPAIQNLSLPFDFAQIETWRQTLPGIIKAINRGQQALANPVFTAWSETQSDSERQKFKLWAEYLNASAQSLNVASNWLEAYSALASGGSDGLRRYLIVFQNSRELRPTGGFIGSVAEITFINGNPTQIIFPPGGAYDFQGGTQTYRPAPAGLNLLRQTLQLQDANWWLNFAISGKEIQRLYSDSAGTSIDGVIAVTANWLPAWLKVIGAQDFPQSAKDKYPNLPDKVTADSVLALIENSENLNPNTVSNITKPKIFLNEVFRVIWVGSLSALTRDPKTFFPHLSDFIGQLTLSKDLQVYASNPEIQNRFRSLGLTGEIRNETQDQFAYVIGSVGGGKSSQQIFSQVEREVRIGTDGTLNVTAKISRSFVKSKDSASNLAQLAYIRLFVPARSVNINVTGSTPPPINYFSVAAKDPAAESRLNRALETELEGRPQTTDPKNIGVWSFLKPGENQVITVDYVVPPQTLFPQNQYNVQIWRQAGNNYTYKQTVILPPKTKVKYHSTSLGNWQPNESDTTQWTWNLETVSRDVIGTLVW